MIVFQFLFAIGSRRRGGVLQFSGRGHGELCGPAEIMRVKDSLTVLERVPCDDRDFGHLASGRGQAREPSDRLSREMWAVVKSAKPGSRRVLIGS